MFLKSEFKGFSLLEVMLAALILAFGIFPIYRHFVRTAAQNLANEKLQMADKILLSIREEILAQRYTLFTEHARGSRAEIDYSKVYTLPAEKFFPGTAANVIAVQQKFKDFQVEGNYRFLLPNDPNQVQCEVVVSWHDDTGKKERKRSFLIVSPR